MRHRSAETICAISTPQGPGALAVIRISGPNALSISQKIIPKLGHKKIETHRVYFADVVDLKKDKVDEVVIAYFGNGRSFTGEETVEISCHGSNIIAHKILDLLIESGAKLAERGEFTYRAFMNNRIDLVQAESVLALIESQNEVSAKIALRQLDGAVSKNFEKLESDLTWCLAHIEASIDFSTEGIDVVETDILILKLKQTLDEINRLIESYKTGRLVKEGIKIVLIGKPNVGKSSLLNVLVQDEKAIVTNVAGTTRDVIEGRTVFEGIQYQVSDTAGLRETKDQVEVIGVDRSKKEALKADVLAVVLALDDEDWAESVELVKTFKSNKVIYILNKSDLRPDVKIEQIREKLQRFNREVILTDVVLASNVDSSTRSRVLISVKQVLGDLSYLDQAVISSTRQLEGAQMAAGLIQQSLVELEKKMGAEFVALFLKQALISLQRILGHVYDDQIMDRVFKEFCLGK